MGRLSTVREEGARGCAASDVPGDGRRRMGQRGHGRDEAAAAARRVARSEARRRGDEIRRNFFLLEEIADGWWGRRPTHRTPEP
jgi:hypothetical protein